MKNIIYKNKTIKHIVALVLIVLTAFSMSMNVNAVENDTYMVRNISISGGTFTSDFKGGNFIYSVYFSSFKENLNVTVELNDERFEYSINGEKLLERDTDNVVVIKVTDPKGEYPDEKYTLNIFFETLGLTYLDVENGIFSPQFDKFHTTYYVILENNIDTFEKAGANWKPANDDAVVEVTCLGELNSDGTLPEGKSTDYRLAVNETDGTAKNYRLKLYRKSASTSAINENALLSSIKINGGAVTMPTFKQEQSFYDVIVPQSIRELDIQAYPVDRSNVAEVVGNTVMKEDESVYVTIVVTSEKYDVSSYYTLRCRYDNAMFTEKHTDLKLISFCMVALTLGVIIGAAVMLLINKKKNKGTFDYNYYNANEGDEQTVE